MPITIKSFGRRKSAGNVLDNAIEPATEPAPTSSFRVIERPEKKPSYSNGPAQQEVKRGFTSPLQALRGKSVENLLNGQNKWVSGTRQSAVPLNQGRGSAGTTNSGSSGGYYESSAASGRHSSSSTLPSSLEQDRGAEDDENDNIFLARKTTAQPVQPPPVPPHQQTSAFPAVAPLDLEDLPPPPSFSARAARAFSFGSRNKTSTKDMAKELNNQAAPAPVLSPPSLPQSPQRTHSPQRERALTTSSYASTAVPNVSKAELTLDADFGGNDDFGSMFDNMRRISAVPPGAGKTAGGPAFHRTDSEPLYPPKTLTRRSFTSSQNNLRRDENESPYSDSGLSSPSLSEPKEGAGYLKGFKTGYSLVPDRHNSPSPGPEESIFAHTAAVIAEPTRPATSRKEDSASYPNRQAQIDDGDRFVKRVELRDSQTPSVSVTSPTRTNTVNADTGTPRRALASPPPSRIDEDSLNRTPRNKVLSQDLTDEPLFDASPVGPPSRAIRPPVLHERTESTGNRRMTKEMFKFLQRRGESSTEQSEDEELTATQDLEDDEDDIDRARKMATQRRKQEANMSVYRQQMKRVTGGGPTDLAPAGKPDMYRGSSAPNLSSGLHFGGIAGAPPNMQNGRPRQADSDEDDDVPLGILQAHGFPSGGRPPTRQGENDLEYQKRSSTTGSIMNGAGGGLPAFARRLPADPYFGAGIVNQSNRESLAIHSSSASVYGGGGGMSHPSQMTQTPGHPGGLIGVIAGEERARAARRGSPNPHGGFSNNSSTALPLPTNMQQVPRTMSMGTVPQAYNGGMPGMMPGMMMPGMPPQMLAQMDPNSPQMQQYMQMQMQLMQNMLAMQQASLGQPQQQMSHMSMLPQSNDFLSVNSFAPGQQRPMSMASTSGYGLAPPNGGRAMTMTAMPAGWNPNGVQSRPASTMFGGGAPSVSNLNLGGPGPGYTPSIAPSERSNVGLPGRYRSVSSLNAAAGAAFSNSLPVAGANNGRSHSMTSSMTLQAFTAQQSSPNLSGTPFNASAATTPIREGPPPQTYKPTTGKSTIRMFDKIKGAAGGKNRASTAITPTAADEDDEDGWAEMRKKRDGKKQMRWGTGAGDKTHSRQSSSAEARELGELYRGLDETAV